MQKRRELYKTSQLLGDEDESTHSNYQSFNDSGELYLTPHLAVPSGDYDDQFYTTGKPCQLSKDRILESALNFR